MAIMVSWLPGWPLFRLPFPEGGVKKIVGKKIGIGGSKFAENTLTTNFLTGTLS